MEEGGSLMEHMNVFNGYLDQLRKVDVKIDEEDKALLLLTSLPDSYDTLVTTLLYGKDTVSLEQVQSSLVSHCTKKRSSFEDGESAALAVQSGNREKKSDGRSMVDLDGATCPVLDKGKKCDDASSCNSLVVADDGDCLTVSKGINTSSHDEWILDSGCTMHVCSKKEFFDTFQERDGGSLFLGDGTPCKIQGVGNVKIKMFDGAVRTLGGVVYIPKLRRNLISLSRMDSNGCKYFAGGGAMKITRVGKVLMKEEKCEGLYRLIGKTVYSTKVWKRCAQGSGYPRCESFAEKTKLYFQVADGCEGVTLVGREDGSRIFFHFNVSIEGQPSKGIAKGFSMNTVKNGKNLGLDEGERGEERDDMDIEGNLAIVLSEEVQIDPNTQEQERDAGYDTKHDNEGINEGINVEMEYPMYRTYPTQEGTSFQEGPPTWVMELQASLGEIKQQEAQIIQTQKRQEEYMGRLENIYYGIRHDVDRLSNFYVEQGSRVNKIGNLCESMHEEHSKNFSNIKDDLEGLWNNLVPHPPPLPFDPYNIPPPPQPYYRQPLY
ncbi:hypothetical protein Acr_00g0048050 [Actinidia rufa]|uniref:Retrovirus-related Pol polyprotein from transposon TNT 1-94-like beta-barrel domain-containing protein n=1 Tax=Actinidia rufa TaxID=165716 RepID=A0A7J0DLS9_9ERIC|nr:hypothetical protein Acr_00g0048050 [Actinidia rufa]